MSMSMEQIMEFARQQWGEGLEPSPGNVHAAPVGLCRARQQLVPQHERGGTIADAEGAWTDEDMLRKNA
jgi:hypothetical protein